MKEEELKNMLNKLNSEFKILFENKNINNNNSKAKCCFECESIEDLCEHHVVPKVLGGTKTITLCVKCHGIVHNKDLLKMKHLSRIGIQKAKERGAYVNNQRPKETPEEFINKPMSVRILKHLKKQQSLRWTATRVGCSINTVSKVYKIATQLNLL